jgi:hypothetical protein
VPRDFAAGTLRRYTDAMNSPSPGTSAAPPQKRRPPAYLFALGRRELPREFDANGTTYRFLKLFKHDFFAATGLYERATGGTGPLAVLKIQRTYPLLGLPMQWLGRKVANQEIRIYEALQGVVGVPRFLARVGATGFAHEFIPGEDLHASLPLTPAFFEQLEKLFADLHERHIAYVDSNKRENILYGEDGKPWLIDFQISFQLKKGERDNFLAKWLFRRFVQADAYHFYKHKTRLLPQACSAEDFARARRRGMLHQLHRWVARPLIVVRRKFLSRYDLANTR